MARLIVTEDEIELAARAADRVTQLIEEAVAARGSAFVSLAGGQTPRRLYANLADADRPWRDGIPWPRLHLFWSDERHVPPDHADSNYGMARRTMIDHVAIAPDHVHRIRGEMADPSEAAIDYERVLDAAFTAAGRHDFTFDVMLLGLGSDGHIASIFPGSELLEESDDLAGHAGRPSGRHAAAVWAPHLNAWRITLIPGAILDSRTILVLVAGANKADAVHAALMGALDVRTCPAQLLRGAGERIEWFLDRTAASGL